MSEPGPGDKNVIKGNVGNVGGNLHVGDKNIYTSGKAPRDYLKDLPPLPADLGFPPRPFRGLRWFTRADARVFFGRGDKISALFNVLTDRGGAAVTLLYGQSGVGKSSLLHAGLLPRLEGHFRVSYLRRNAETGLLPALVDSLAEGETGDPPRLLILDQLEEIFTRPLPPEAEEAAGLARLLRETPEVRWLLGFRKEYLAEFQQLLASIDVDPYGVYVGPLAHANIVEAVEGISRDPACRERYQLSIEAGVAETIARDISRDRDSHVAPALQILLTKLWQVATGTPETDRSLARVIEQLRASGYRPNPAAPHFTHELFQQTVAESGLLMDEFLGEQLRLLAADHPRRAESGLLLGLLRFFTTDLGTARARPTAEVEAAYGHLPDLPALLLSLRDRYLLTESEAGQPRLAHDALAPLVRRRFAASQAPGPAARAILEYHLGEGRRAGGAVAVLDRSELRTVLAGRREMRDLRPPERELIARSLRRRTRQRLLTAAVALLVLISVAIAGYREYQNNQILKEQYGQLLEDEADRIEDPAAKLAAYRASLAVADDPAVREKLYRTYRENPLPRQLLPPEAAYAVAFGPDGRDLILAIREGEGHRLERHTFEAATGGYRLANTLEGTVSAAQEAIEISADGQTVVAGGHDHRLHAWHLSGHRIPTGAFPVLVSVSDLAISDDGRFVAAAFFDRPFVRRYDLRGEQPVAEYALPYVPATLTATGTGFYVAAPGEGGRHYDWAGRPLSGPAPDSTSAAGRLTARFGLPAAPDRAAWLAAEQLVMTFSPEAGLRSWDLRYRHARSLLVRSVRPTALARPGEGELLVATYDGKVLRANPDSGPVPEGAAAGAVVDLVGDAFGGAALTSLAATADRTVVADEHGRLLFYPAGAARPLRDWLAVHREAVRHLHITSDGRYALSAGADRRVVRWDARTGDTLATIYTGDLAGLDLSPAGDRVALLDGAGTVRILGGSDWQREEHRWPVDTSEGSNWHAVAFLDAGRLLLVGDDRYLIVTPAGERLRTVRMNFGSRPVHGVRHGDPARPGNARLVIYGPGGAWLVDAAGYVFQVVDRIGAVRDVALSGDELHLIAGKEVLTVAVDPHGPTGIAAGEVAKEPDR